MTETIEKFSFNSGVAAIYKFANALAELKPEALADAAGLWARKEALDVLALLIGPMMPHLAEQCWQVLGHQGLVSEANWPETEAKLLVDDTITLPVQVNGKKRADVTVGRNASNGEIEAAVLALDAVKSALDGKSSRKVIIVPQRIVNVVV